MTDISERLVQAELDKQKIVDNINELNAQIKSNERTYKPGDILVSPGGNYYEAKIYRNCHTNEVILVSPDDNWIWNRKLFRPKDCFAITRQELDSWKFDGWK